MRLFRQESPVLEPNALPPVLLEALGQLDQNALVLAPGEEMDLFKAKNYWQLFEWFEEQISNKQAPSMFPVDQSVKVAMS